MPKKLDYETRTGTLAAIWKKVERVQALDPMETQMGFPLDVLIPGFIFAEIGIAQAVMSVIAGADPETSEQLLLKKATPVIEHLSTTKVKHISEQLKTDIHRAMLEASRLSGDTLNALSCGACEGPVGVHDETCGWCESGLTRSK